MAVYYVVVPILRKSSSILPLTLLLIYQVTMIYAYCSRLEDSSTQFWQPRSNLCSNQSMSCSHQLQESEAENCSMLWLAKLSPECSADEFISDGEVQGASGDIRISSYVFKEKTLNISAINVTFTNIKWERLRMRFMKNTEANTQEAKICREFRVSSSISPNSTLFFDCLWSLQTYENKTYHLQAKSYFNDGSSAVYNYVFVVPSSVLRGPELCNVSEWQLFMYVDITALPQMTLYIEPPPRHLGVTGYKVDLYRTSDPENKPWVVLRRHLQLQEPLQHLNFTYNAEKQGFYHFTVYPDHSNCSKDDDVIPSCFGSKSPMILIATTQNQARMIAFVATVLLIPILLTAYFIWKRKMTTEVVSGERLPPKVLLIYNPSHADMVRSMIELAKYLTKVCHLEALLDQLCIPASNSKDPQRWYIDAFNETDYVAVFASEPQLEKPQYHKYNTYINLEAIALTQLRHHLCSPSSRLKAVAVALPQCSWDTLPPEAKVLRKFSLPAMLDPLLVFFGTAPQCDSGKGLLSVLDFTPELQTPDEFPLAEYILPDTLLDCSASSDTGILEDRKSLSSSSLNQLNLLGD